MTLPTFLGIGVPRGGSTWLHTLLASHPQVYMPTRRKEIRFFDRDYERGLDWYETFFPSTEYQQLYQAIGEISPQYYKSEPCPARIFTTLPDSKLLIILRQPINRAYSVYGFHVQRRNFKGSFEDFLTVRPEILEQGFYCQYIKRYLCYFDRTQIFALVFEDAVSNIAGTKAALANFLGLAADKFPLAAGGKKVNASSVPKNRFLYSFAVKTGHYLHKWRMDRVVDRVRRLNIERFLAKGSPMPPLDQELKNRLSQIYLAEFDKLEQCLDIDLSSWR